MRTCRATLDDAAPASAPLPGGAALARGAEVARGAAVERGAEPHAGRRRFTDLLPVHPMRHVRHNR